MKHYKIIVFLILLPLHICSIANNQQLDNLETLLIENKYMDVITIVEKYMQEHPTDSIFPTNRIYYAKALAFQERYAEADYHLTKAEIEIERDWSVKLAGCYLFHGSVYEKLTNIPRAINYYVAAIEVLYLINQRDGFIPKKCKDIHAHATSRLSLLNFERDYDAENFNSYLQTKYPPINYGNNEELEEIPYVLSKEFFNELLQAKLEENYKKEEELIEYYKDFDVNIYADFLRLLGESYLMFQHVEDALRVFRKASEIKHTNLILPEKELNNETLIEAYKALTNLTLEKEVTKQNLLEAWHYSAKVDSILMEQTERKLLFMNERERIYVRNENKIQYEKTYSIFQKLRDKNLLDHTIIEHLFAINLFHQGLLLKTEQFTRKNINLSEDWKELNKKITLLKEKTRTEQTDRDSKEYAEMEVLERQMIVLSNLRSTHRLTTDWRSIQNKLKENEAAILFSFSEDEQTRFRPEYDIFIITHQSSHPEYINVPVSLFYLPEEYLKQPLQNMIEEINEVYSSSKHYILLWKDICEKHLDGINTLYYSSINCLNSLSVDALIDEDKKTMMEKYIMRRLTSLDEIHRINSGYNSLSGNFALFGDVRYYSPSLPADSLKRQNISTRADKLYPLAYSQKEIIEIHKLLKKKQISTDLYTRRDATETVVRNFSTRSPEVIHFSTHGFFVEDYSIPSTPSSKTSIFDSKGGMIDEVIANMRSSGLFLFNAGMKWNEKKAIEIEDDGILTSEEISFLDLSNTKLVVLSACETGLGVKQDTEGIYGLQRAFKQAGVQSIIMSLWKVDDEATSDLMIAFYNKWLSGKDKHEAFRQAQLLMREKYKEPYYWAGFVMLD